MAKPETVTARILDRLDTLHRKRRGARLVRALLWTLTVALTTSAIALALDATFGWWSITVRVCISLSALTMTIASLVYGLRWATKRDEDKTLAAVADQRAPFMQERLQTIVSSTEDSGRHFGADRLMLQQVASETEQLIDRFDPQVASVEASRNQPRIAVSIALAVWVGLILWLGSDVGVLLGRLLAPTSNLTRHRIEGLVGDQVIARGEPFEMELIGAGSTGEVITLERRFANQSDNESKAQQVTESIELTAADRVFQYRQRRTLDSFDYRVTTGDLRTSWYRAMVASRPRVKNVKLKVTPPEYTKLPAKTFARMPNRMTVIEGSQVEFLAHVDGDAQIAMLQIQEKSPRTMFERQPGQFATVLQIEQETKIAIEVTERHGLKNLKLPKSHFLTRPDLPPSVRLHSPSPDQKVRPDDVIELKFTAKDDIGLARARVVIEVENQDANTSDLDQDPVKLDSIDIPVPTNTSEGDQPLTKWNGSTKLDLSKYELEEGQTLSYRIEVFDTKQAEILESHESSTDADTPDTPSVIPMDELSNSANDTPDAKRADSEIESSEGTSEPSAAKEVSSDQSSGESMTQDTPPTASDPTDSVDAARANRSAITEGDSDSKQVQTASGDPSSDRTENMVQSDDQQAGDGNNNASSDRHSQSTGTGRTDNQKDDSDKANMDSAEKQSDDTNSSPQTDSEIEQDSQQPQTSGGSSSSNPTDSSSDPNGQPPNPLTTRRIDLPQPSSSQSQRLRVSETVGTFVSEARRKSEIAIAQTFREVEALLNSARDSLASILQTHRDQSEDWQDEHAIAAARAHQDLEHATDSIRALIARTKETPYAFIGLQLAEIAHTHIIPARKDAKSVENSHGETRLALITASRQQVVRALERLQSLYKTYEKAKKDFEIAKNVQSIEKLYRVYLEDALAELQRASREGDGTPGLERTMAELNLDEEYLKRLQEVLEMQRDLRAELAKILADDARLMRRYFQNFGNGGRSIRDQLYDLAKEQRGHFDVSTSYQKSMESGDKSAISQTVAEHAQTLAIDAMDLVERSLEIEETFETWLPLDETETPSIRAARASFLGVAAAAGDVTTTFETEVASDLFAGDSSIEIEKVTSLLSSSADAIGSLTKALDAASATLAEMADNEPELVENATRRMIDLQEVQAIAARWQTKARLIADGKYAAAIGVSQVNTTIKTHDLTEKLTGLQRELARQLNPDTNTLPESIAEACNRLLEQLDQEIEPLQLASVRALQQANLPRANQRLESASNSFDEACKLADELLQSVIKLLDEMPPDPLADLLDDPTLDEILARLEEERQLSETLGIPARPTNLQVINDWANGANGPGGSARTRLMQMIRQAMEAQQKKQLKRLAGIRKQLLARHIEQDNKIEEQPDGKGSVFGWNVLRSRLSAGLLQESDGLPPESYRRSIDRYFEIISSVEPE